MVSGSRHGADARARGWPGHLVPPRERQERSILRPVTRGFSALMSSNSFCTCCLSNVSAENDALARRFEFAASTHDANRGRHCRTAHTCKLPESSVAQSWNKQAALAVTSPSARQVNEHQPNTYLCTWMLRNRQCDGEVPRPADCSLYQSGLNLGILSHPLHKAGIQNGNGRL